MPSNERPEWASGPEWDGWESDYGLCMRHRPESNYSFAVDRNGWLDIFQYEEAVKIQFPSPDHARHVVEKIIEESIEEASDAK